MARTLTTARALGWSEEDVLRLAVEIARYAAYQLAGDERGEDWRRIAAAESANAAIGEERWMRLARFTLDAVSGLQLNGETDERGPVVRTDEMARLGGLVLVQFAAQDA